MINVNANWVSTNTHYSTVYINTMSLQDKEAKCNCNEF